MRLAAEIPHHSIGAQRHIYIHEWLSAETFADNPGVIGYDILNEPYGDEETEIGPLYEDAAKRIRKYDKKAILFIEPQVRATSSSCEASPGCCFAPAVIQ